MCMADGMRHGSHGVYSDGNDTSENYPLQRQVVRYSNPQSGNYQSNSVDYN